MSSRREDRENSGDNLGVTRRELMEDLSNVVETAMDKFDRIRASNKDRMSWGRLIVTAVKAMGDILKDSDIDDLVRRVERLEELKG